MKLLRETIRRILLESDEPCELFMAEMEKRFEKRSGKDGYDRLAKVFPDGCEVHFLIEELGGNYVYFESIETIGDECVRKGYARETLQSIAHLADELNIWILGKANPFKPTQGSTSGDRPDKQELINFYRSMGGRIVDGNEFERPPRKLTK